jgi:hypothetical protein
MPPCETLKRADVRMIASSTERVSGSDFGMSIRKKQAFVVK